MRRISNKVLAAVSIAPWALFFVLGAIEGMLGYSDFQTILPLVVEDIIAFVGIIITVVALIRLYNLPDVAGGVTQSVS